MYNGWTNYQTWRVVVELDNEHWLYDIWRNKMSEIYGECNTHNARVEAFASFLRDLVEFFNPVFGKSNALYTDLLTSALEQIDYGDIAESFVADYEYEVRDHK